MITPEEKRSRIEDLNQHISSMHITDAVMLPNVWELHRRLLKSDKMCFFMLMQFTDGIRVTDCSENVKRVTGLDEDYFMGKYLNQIEKDDNCNTDELLSELQRRAVSKIVTINENQFLVLMWKEGHNSYGEYMIRL